MDGRVINWDGDCRRESRFEEVLWLFFVVWDFLYFLFYFILVIGFKKWSRDLSWAC